MTEELDQLLQNLKLHGMHAVYDEHLRAESPRDQRAVRSDALIPLSTVAQAQYDNFHF